MELRVSQRYQTNGGAFLTEHGLLIKKDIESALKKEIVLEPRLDPLHISGSGLDLRLDVYFREYRGTKNEMADVAEETIEESMYQLRKVQIRQREDGSLEIEPIVIHRNSFILAQTLEYISLPNNVVGHLDGRSSLGRRGLLIHTTAGLIDAGFSGHITLELGNVGRLPIKIYPLMRIAHLQFTYTNNTDAYTGQFSRQIRIKPPKPDPDLRMVLRMRDTSKAGVYSSTDWLSARGTIRFGRRKVNLDSYQGFGSTSGLIPSTGLCPICHKGELIPTYFKKGNYYCPALVCNNPETNGEHLFKFKDAECIEEADFDSFT